MSSRLLSVVFVALLCCQSSLWSNRVTTASEGPGSGNVWAFTPPRKPALPTVQSKHWVADPIDAFVLSRLEAAGLAPNERADKLTLLRRVTFDLTGLLPTLEEQDAFLADHSPDAYAKVVDRLLDSPRYGERWAQHWLDLVRYAETDGFKADDYRPNAFRYRDYVIRALNKDMPYDRFVRQQLAGDELEPNNPDALIATGFLRLWPDEYNAANLEQRRQEILDDVTEVSALSYMGLTMGCARCHDHKFDPILQTEHYQLQAFFAAIRTRDDQVAADAQEQSEYRRQLAAWETATRDIRAEMEKIVATKREQERKSALEKFRTEIQLAELTPLRERTPYQQQIALMAEQQMDRAEREAPQKLPGEQKKRYQELEKQLGAVEPRKPQPLPGILSVSDVGHQAPPTHLLATGNWRKPREELTAEFPHFLTHLQPDTGIDARLESTGRRAALARWLTRSDHPLTARVMMNRLWQHHFGRGIVATPSDFGNQGEKPSHQELLDWLAVEFVGNGWSLKHMHRLMVTSATYCQSSLVNLSGPGAKKAREADRENRLLWHANRRRLEGEAIRDTMLQLSSELNFQMYGPSARPKLPEAVGRYAWKPDGKPEDQNRRSVYVFAKRNMRYPLFDVFDLPDRHNSCARRSTTTTAPQALLMLNSELTLERAEQWGERLKKQFPTNRCALVEEAYRAALGRPAGDVEINSALKFISHQSVTDFCHAILNSNEFLYVD